MKKDDRSRRSEPPTRAHQADDGRGRDGRARGEQSRMLSLPRRIATSDQLNALIEQLQELWVEMAFAEFDVTLTD